MTLFLGWALFIAITAAALVFAADAKYHYAHIAISALAAVTFVYFALRENASALKAGASTSAIAGISARNMGLVWTWGALVLLATYTAVLDWREWWQFFIGFAAAAGLSLFFSKSILSDAEKASEDQTMLKRARYLSIGQLVAMIGTMIGLLIDGKMTRFMNPRYTDWAANNVFFFGALALAVISFSALRANSGAPRQPSGAS